ncbi:MAG: hypothetical protein AB7Y46_17790, partial [Armatimonadota bacterium]
MPIPAWQSASSRYLAQIPLFGPEDGVTVRAPLDAGPGWWAGAPSALYDEQSGRFYLYYRLRKPRELGRGVECRIAASEDGIAFDDIWQMGKEQLDSPSVEKSCIFRAPDGSWRLYISYVDPQTNMWRIDGMVAEAPDKFDPAQRTPMLVPDELGLEGVKDPAVYRIGPMYYMIVSYAPAAAASEEEKHGSADVYNTGIVKSHTGLATSGCGLHWRWQGDILSPPETGWDSYCTRIGSVLYRPPVFIGFYDGSASVAENYDEKAGLAVSYDLRHWERATRWAPFVTSPHGCIRYIEVVPDADALYYYYVWTRADGSHEQRVSRVEGCGAPGR